MVFASPRAYMLLSTAAAVATIVLKTLAWRLTGSVGLLSDAMESGVNLVAALGAIWALTLAAKPADRSHPYGHFKAEYFSSGLESVLIVVAALAIMHTAIGRLQQPQPLEQLGIGLVISLLATALNGLVAWVLLKASRRFDSITLRADAHHLLTDVWTSLGVVLGIGLVKLTGLTILDPLIAIAVAMNIVVTGWKLFHETASGLLDRSLSDPARAWSLERAGRPRPLRSVGAQGGGHLDPHACVHSPRADRGSESLGRSRIPLGAGLRHCKQCSEEPTLSFGPAELL